MTPLANILWVHSGEDGVDVYLQFPDRQVTTERRVTFPLNSYQNTILLETEEDGMDLFRNKESDESLYYVPADFLFRPNTLEDAPMCTKPLDD